MGGLMTFIGTTSTYILHPYVQETVMASTNGTQEQVNFDVTLLTHTHATVFFIVLMMLVAAAKRFEHHRFICNVKALANKGGAALLFTGILLQLDFNQMKAAEAYVATVRPLIVPLTLVFSSLWRLRTHSGSPYYHFLPILACVFCSGSYLLTFYTIFRSDSVKNAFEVQGTKNIESTVYYCVTSIAEALFHTMSFAYFRRHLRLGELERAMFGAKHTRASNQNRRTSNPSRVSVVLAYVGLSSLVVCILLWLVPFVYPAAFNLPEADRFAHIKLTFQSLYQADDIAAWTHVVGYICGYVFVVSGFALLNSISAPLTAITTLLAFPAKRIIVNAWPDALFANSTYLYQYNGDRLTNYEIGYSIGGLLLIFAALVLYTTFLLMKPPRYAAVPTEDGMTVQSAAQADDEYQVLRLEENPHLK